MKVRLAVWLGVFVVGCAARTDLDVAHDAGTADARVRDAAKDVAEEDVVDAGPDVVLSPFCTTNDAVKPAKTCKVQAYVESLVTQSGCYVDVVVHQDDTGTIEYACDGVSTWASATFNGKVFEGTVTNGSFVDICIGTTYSWEDGPACNHQKSTWASSQRIYGDVSTGALTFVYDEREIAGTSCDFQCTAFADIVLK